MNKIIILLTMFFLHIVDDYYLQGVLAKMKQKSWWEENAPDPLYKNDHKVALLCHAFSWTFMIMLPITVSLYGRNDVESFIYYIIYFSCNVIVHSMVDNAKANSKSINLITDQALHLFQIVVTWFVFFVV